MYTPYVCMYIAHPRNAHSTRPNIRRHTGKTDLRPPRQMHSSRDVIYGMLLFCERKDMHRTVAQALLQEGETDHALVAHHCIKCEDFGVWGYPTPPPSTPAQHEWDLWLPTKTTDSQSHTHFCGILYVYCAKILPSGAMFHKSVSIDVECSGTCMFKSKLVKKFCMNKTCCCSLFV